MSDLRIEQIVTQLGLESHPEGGFYKETYRSQGTIESSALPNDYQGDRNYATCIFFLLTSDNFSAFHKIKQDEIWHFYAGSPISIHVISNSGDYKKHKIGSDLEKGLSPQLVVYGGDWFASEVEEPNSYALAGCSVSPGFDFADFDLADRNKLSLEFPEYQSIIKKLTRLAKG